MSAVAVGEMAGEYRRFWKPGVLCAAQPFGVTGHWPQPSRIGGRLHWNRPSEAAASRAGSMQIRGFLA